MRWKWLLCVFVAKHYNVQKNSENCDIDFIKLLFQLHCIQLKSLCEQQAIRRNELEHPTNRNIYMLLTFFVGGWLLSSVNRLRTCAPSQTRVLHE